MAESPPLATPSPKLSSLSQRLLVAIGIIVVGVPIVLIGGWVFVAFVALILGMAIWEYWRMFQIGGYRPSATLMIGGTLVLVVTRHLWGFQTAPFLLSFFALGAIAHQVFDYKNSEKTSALNFNINLGGLIYIGWLGCYIISLRNLPDGMWWILLVIPTTGMVDGGAFFMGSLFGKHRMAPRISPKKSWEGYIGGVLFGVLGGALLAVFLQMRAPSIQPWLGLTIGALIGLVTPIGDLGESVMKRSFGVKDSGSVLPGHGGILDRIDSWLWAAPISYYVIVLLLSGIQ
jgi:phosphatidate cytidylyltransferase